MSEEPRLTELLMQWEELRLQGRNVAAEELCSDSTDLLDELQRRIRALEALDPVLTVWSSVVDDATVTGEPQTDERSEWPVLAGYEVLSKLGEGGMGVVYKVRNLAVGRVEALKMIRPRSALNPLVKQRFQTEIKAMAKFAHARIVRIYAAGLHEEHPYFTMEYVESGALAQQMRRFADNHAAALALTTKIAQAVHYLHTENIVHRDLKPANILLKKEQDELLVSDFGLAKLFDPAPEPAGAVDSDADANLTQVGAVIGTAAYMSPEQAAGQTNQLGTATDVWAIGVILYELLTGHRPFQGADSESVREAVQSTEPLPPSHYRPKLPRDIEAVCLRCLNKDPSRRYPTAQALVDDLERLQRGEPILPESWPRRLWRIVRRSPTLSTAASLLFVFAIVVTVLWTRHRFTDPDAKTALAEVNLQKVLGDLTTGKRVTLIPALGPPAAYRWATRDFHDALSQDPEKPFSLHAEGFALLELVPAHPLERYRLRAEIHHDGGRPEGRVGIYIGYSRQTLASGAPMHCFCSIDFNDIATGQPPEKGNSLLTQLYSLYAKMPGQAPDVVRPMSVGVSTSFQPTGLPPPEVWRTLQIDVEPEAVRITWEKKELPPLRRDKLDFYAQQILKGIPQQLLEAPRFLPQEAVGIYAFRASAWFRSCTIESLPNPQPN